jgi:hypothetical protein
MEDDAELRDALDAAAKERFARAVVTGCFWPFVKGVLIGLGLIILLLAYVPDLIGS